uniref:C2H2-type domain-containing protein n=1 Tax=Octopus bimaculoides TaxID=37653 RepID=A0A0L8FUL0_OCTBM
MPKRIDLVHKMLEEKFQTSFCCDICERHSYRNITKSNGSKTCDICSNLLSGSGPLTLHKHVHTRKKSHYCDIWAKSFTQNSGINAHKCIRLRRQTTSLGYLC